MRPPPAPSQTFTRMAPAKINLFLHLVGRRSDGYHLLESLVAFTDFGDQLSITPAQETALRVTGPFGTPALQENNSVLAALEILQKALKVRDSFTITLEKNLPVAAGIGGGSSDAAAMMHLLNAYYETPLDDCDLEELGLKIGADVPVCLRGQTHWMGGIGEQLFEAPWLGSAHILLLNNRNPLGTSAVFKAYEALKAPFSPELPTMPHPSDYWSGQEDLFLESVGRNDLTQAAITLDPSLEALLQGIEAQEGCVFSRMSGSGGTCFGVFSTQASLKAAETNLTRRFPDHWVQSGSLV